MYPEDRQYTKEHEWVRVDGDTATVGITHFAQDQLGDIVYVEVPEVGQAFKKDDVLGTIESVKAVSEIYSPLGGMVVEVNETLEAQPERVNGEPHESGWYCKLRLSDPTELESMMSAAEYSTFAESQ